MEELLFKIIAIVLTIVLSWLGEKAIVLLSNLINKAKSKIKSDKIKESLDLLEKVITNAVKVVYQTYVEELKNNGTFDIDKQEQAFNKAKEIVVKQTSKDIKDYIDENLGGFNKWLESNIEATLYNLKNK